MTKIRNLLARRKWAWLQCRRQLQMIIIKNYLKLHWLCQKRLVRLDYDFKTNQNILKWGFNPK